MKRAALLHDVCVGFAAAFLLAALVAFAGWFDRVETLTTALAGVSTAFAVLAWALHPAQARRPPGGPIRSGPADEGGVQAVTARSPDPRRTT